MATSEKRNAAELQFHRSEENCSRPREGGTNLFIGIVVNAMQTEHEKSIVGERAAEHDMIHDETAPLVSEIKALRHEIAELRQRIETIGN